jgi:restriction endonuclease Mrr
MRDSPKVFISYTSSDTWAANRLFDHLLQSGAAPFLDRVSLSPGEHILSALRAQIAAADVVVLLLSPEALTSAWFQSELEYTVSTELRQRSITVVPVKVKPCQVPDFLAAWTIIDATRNFDKAIADLAVLISAVPQIQLERLDPREFEAFVGDLLRAYGFRHVKAALGQNDIGFDFSAQTMQRDPFGRPEVVDWLIEVKSAKGQADTSSLRAFLGVLSLRKARGLFITGGQLTTPAKEWLEQVTRTGGPRLSLIEGTELKRLVMAKPRLVRKYFDGQGAQA